MRFRLALVAACLAGTILHGAGPLPQPGETFATETALVERLQPAGLVKVAKLNPTWPARVTGLQEARDEIEYTIPGQPTQRFKRDVYAGYRFVLVRLKGTGPGGSEFGVLFRSAKREP